MFPNNNYPYYPSNSNNVGYPSSSHQYSPNRQGSSNLPYVQNQGSWLSYSDPICANNNCREKLSAVFNPEQNYSDQILRIRIKQITNPDSTPNWTGVFCLKCYWKYLKNLRETNTQKYILNQAEWEKLRLQLYKLIESSYYTLKEKYQGLKSNNEILQKELIEARKEISILKKITMQGRDEFINLSLSNSSSSSIYPAMGFAVANQGQYSPGSSSAGSQMSFTGVLGSPQSSGGWTTDMSGTSVLNPTIYHNQQYQEGSSYPQYPHNPNSNWY